MQHYGLPSRLLDWSESLLIAAYFAVCDHKKWDRPGAIWALDPFELNKTIMGTKSTITAHDPVGDLAANLPFMKDDYKKFPEKYQRDLVEQLAHNIIAMEPDEVDLRMLVQQSVFTIHGSMIEDEAAAFQEVSLRKYVIPVDKKKTFAHALACAGVRRSTVFPDLENLATELRDESIDSSMATVEESDAVNGASRHR